MHLFFQKMRAIEPELLKSNGGHRLQTTLPTVFLSGPMGRIDASQVVDAYHEPFNSPPAR